MDSQESSPTPQFKSVNSSALSFLYSPILTSIHAAAAAKSRQSCPTLCETDPLTLIVWTTQEEPSGKDNDLGDDAKFFWMAQFIDA